MDSEVIRIALEKLRDPAAPASPDILEAVQFARLETIDALMTFDLVEFDTISSNAHLSRRSKRFVN